MTISDILEAPETEEQYYKGGYNEIYEFKNTSAIMDFLPELDGDYTYWAHEDIEITEKEIPKSEKSDWNQALVVTLDGEPVMVTYRRGINKPHWEEQHAKRYIVYADLFRQMIESIEEYRVKIIKGYREVDCDINEKIDL